MCSPTSANGSVVVVSQHSQVANATGEADSGTDAAVAELLAIARRVYPHGDKFNKHTYEHIYAQHLAHIRHRRLKFLESASRARPT